MDRRLGFLFVALAVIIHGSLGVTSKALLDVATTNAYSITLLRALIAFLACLLISVLALGKRAFWIARRDIRTMVFAGLLMALYQITFIVALSLSNVTIGALVTLCTVPVFAALLSRALLGETLRPSTLLALVCAIVGVAMLVGFDDLQSGHKPWMGVGFALVSALGYALFQVCGRVLANRYHPIQTLSVFFLVAAASGAAA